MQVTKNITLDLLETGSPVIIKAKQNDRNTRYIAAHLYVDGLAYPVPSGTEIAFRYKKPDGTAGFYDTLPDNSPAITVSGNTVTVELVEQVLTAAGCVHCEINMYNAASEKLTTFTFEISVEESVLTDAEIISSDYYNVLTAEIEKALQAVTDATEQAENAAQSAQNAADSAAMSKDWAAGQPVTYSGAPVSIAYAGAQRIASITAYGETPQGGTTEAPVALTGVDLVHVCRRNLFPCVETSGVTNGITKTVNTDGSITLSGTATDRVVIFITNRKSPIVLSKGTYTIGIGATIPDGCAIALGHYHGNKYIGGLMVMSAGKSYKSFQVSNITGVLEGYFEIKSGTTVNTTIYPMLNLGSTAMPYEPYQGSVTTLLIPRPLRRVGDVRDVCRTRVKSKWDKSLQVESSKLKKNNANAYQYYINTDTEDVNRTVEPGCNRFTPNYTAGISAFSGGFNFWMKGVLEVDDLEHAKAWFDEHPTKVFYQSTAYDGTNGLDVCLTEYQTGYIESYADESITTAWISSTGELSTGAEVAYVLSSPETYATEPLDFDNAAGPLTVMTGGELEVRMTELVGSRSNVSNNTVAFSEAAQDADIQTEETLSTLFGKIKKRLSVITTTFAKLSNLAYGNEVDTGLTWLDGKKIYRKTAKITPSQYAVLEEGDPVTYTATVENWMVGINEICMLQGMLVNPEGYYLPLGAKRNGNNDYGGYIAASIENNIVKLTIGTGARPLAASNISHFTVICEYTKI